MVKTTTAKASTAKNASTTTTATVTTPAPICLTAGYTIAQHVALQNPTGTHGQQIVNNWLTTVGGTQAQCNVVICPNIANNAYVAKHIANIGSPAQNGVATRSILALVYGIPVVNGVMLGQSLTAQFKAAKASVKNGAPPTANNTSNPCPSVAATTQKTFTLAQLLAYWGFVSGTCKGNKKAPNAYKSISKSWRLIACGLSGGLSSNAVGFGNGFIKLQLPAKAPVK